MNLKEIYERLGLTDDCLIKLSDADWKSKVSFPSRIYRLLETNEMKICAYVCLIKMISLLLCSI